MEMAKEQSVSSTLSIEVSDCVVVDDNLGNQPMHFAIHQKEESPAWQDDIVLFQSVVYTESDRVTRAGPLSFSVIEYVGITGGPLSEGRLCDVWIM